MQKNVSVDFRNISIYDALMQLETKAGVYFSYDNQFIKNRKKLSFAAENKSVKEVLDLILDNEYQYIINNNKIVIRKKEQEFLTIQGQFRDHTDQNPVEYVTVYEPELQSGTMSNAQGNFSIKLPVKNTIKLQVNRVSYYDTSIIIDPKNYKPLVINLTPKITTETPVIVRTVERHWLAKTVIGTRQKINSVNLKNYFYKRKFQLGFWPGMGTKNAIKGQQENYISFNVFGGYTAQVDAVEIGGLFNIVQKHVHALQIGGLFNVVGGKVTGMQVAGLYNYAGDDVNGLQIGGLVNINKADNKGFQIGGLYNQNQNFKGLQIGGLANISKNIDKGMQISGLVSRANQLEKGMQLSGLVNHAKKINGAQVSGLINYAKKANGFQLGIFNIADSLQGVSIGPFNYSRNGKHTLSISFQENNQLNLSYKSGSYVLYNILQAGIIQTGDKNRYYIFGYGLGTEWKIKKKIKLGTELVSLFYNSKNDVKTDYSTICLQPLILFQLNKNLQLFAGPRLQYQLPVYQQANDYYNSFHKNSIALTKGSNTSLYLGFNAGINIF
ncbi:MAG TPA: STN and carboxypeptidase regulatory-like domain-containing protein [Niabella sp.]|nr:STN and carboxypeptidase regulatory-like domain-containing protein [Niabella sp.]HOZ95595.1 STN and carboxypeptidase regulatory-like domain-containing protein [Niabella sp.]HQW13835.1 STN and carboxypeptidase regulatory-like domain-containing protein [Niabella sp.]HQX19272.1 STN and carboxypeptidase regulatory-like domain-containing protein [Niabella sp.]HQX42115.1 STN and carboxypeptidase regulatory-like domain-containing protein [Niabella sp.]